MKTYKKIIIGGAIAAGLLALIGCPKDDSSKHRNYDKTISSQKVPYSVDTSYVKYFADSTRVGGPYNSFAGGSGVAVGDMDSDGDLDIIVADRGASMHYLENIDGKFIDRGRITEGQNSFAGDCDITLADIDKDGDLDIIYSDRGASVYVAMNNLPQKSK